MTFQKNNIEKLMTKHVFPIVKWFCDRFPVANMILTFTLMLCTVPARGGSLGGHEYVDLGLPSGTMWAACNVGASAPEEYGTLESGTCGDALSYVLYDDGELVISGEGAMNNYSQTPWKNREAISKVTINEGVTRIGNYAFRDCYHLNNISIPNSVTSIGDYAFYGCNNLSVIDLPEGLAKIGSSAFYGCSGATRVHVPKSVTTIDKYAFYYCAGALTIDCATIPNSGFKNANFSSVEIGKNVTMIENYAFQGCSPNSLIIGANVKKIGSSAFGGPVKTIWLTNTPPEGYKHAEGIVNYVSNDKFAELKKVMTYPYLSSMFVNEGIRYAVVSPSERTCDIIDCTYGDDTYSTSIQKSVSYLGVEMKVMQVNEYAFYKNGKLKQMTINHSGDIGDYAFCDCDGLKQIVVSNGGNVGNLAFSGCDGLESAELSNSGNISSEAFYNCKKLRTVSISNTGDIAGYAFKDCIALQQAQVNNTGAVGDYAFYNCIMSELTLGNGVTSLGNSAFANCSQLQYVEIPDAVTQIGTQCFASCPYLIYVYIGNGLTAIPAKAFENCGIQEVSIGSGVQSIGEKAFSKCKALQEVVVPSNVASIGNYAFDGCISLQKFTINNRKEMLTLGSNGSKPLFDACPLVNLFIGGPIQYNATSSYGYSPFYRNETLKNVTISDAEKEVYDNEFYGCTNLQTVMIGDGVTKIGSWAFSGCSSLESFRFGENVTQIDQEAFSDCNSLTDIVSEAAVPPVCGNQALEDINKWQCSLYVPEANIADYQAASQWKDFFFVKDIMEKQETYICGENIIATLTPKEGVLNVVGTGAMYDYAEGNDAPWVEYLDNIKQVNLSEGITYIGIAAFMGTAISSVTIPASVQYVSQEVFSWCENLTAINVNAKNEYYFSKDGVLYSHHYTDIFGNYQLTGNDAVVLAAYPCGRIGSFSLPSNVIKIEDEAFFGCQNLTSIYMNEGLQEIGKFAFQMANGLKTVKIPNSVTYIDDYAFSLCEKMEKMEIGSGLQWYGSGVIWNSKALTTVNVSEDNQVYSSINGAIYSKDGKTLDRCPEGKKGRFEIPEGVEYIGENGYHYSPFYECEYLTSITIPEGVSHIGREAFDGCKGLKSLSLPSTVTSIGFAAFYACTNLETMQCYAVEVPETYYNAFYSTPRKEGTLYVPAKAVSAYASAEPWTEWATIKPLGKGTLNIDGVIYSYDLSKQTAAVVDGKSATGVVHVLSSINVDGYDCKVTTIGEDAFYGSPATAIHIPASVTYISYCAFVASSIRNIYCYATDRMTVAEKNAAELTWESMVSRTLHVPADLVETYEADYSWMCFIKAVFPLTEEETSIGTVHSRRPTATHDSDGTLIVEGLAKDEMVSVHSVDGRLLGTAVANGGKARIAIGAKADAMVIVKTGSQTMKVMW